MNALQFLRDLTVRQLIRGFTLIGLFLLAMGLFVAALAQSDGFDGCIAAGGGSACVSGFPELNATAGDRRKYEDLWNPPPPRPVSPHLFEHMENRAIEVYDGNYRRLCKRSSPECRAGLLD